MNVCSALFTVHNRVNNDDIVAYSQVFSFCYYWIRALRDVVKYFGTATVVNLFVRLLIIREWCITSDGFWCIIL